MLQGSEDANTDGRGKLQSDTDDQTTATASGVTRCISPSAVQPSPKRQKTSATSLGTSVSGTPLGSNVRSTLINHLSLQNQGTSGVSVERRLQNLNIPVTVKDGSLSGTETLVSPQVEHLIKTNVGAAPGLLQLQASCQSSSVTQPVIMCCTVLTQPISAVTTSQNVVSELVLTPADIAAQSASEVAVSLPPGDVTTVHSYSRASVSSISPSAPNSNVYNVRNQVTLQKSNNLTTNVLPVSSVQSESVANPLSQSNVDKNPDTSTNPTETTSVNSTVNQILQCVSSVNKLLHRTSYSFTEGVIKSSIPVTVPSSEPKKKSESVPPANDEKAVQRQKVIEFLEHKVHQLRLRYYAQQIAFFFLKNGGNILDYSAWQKKPPNQLSEYLRANPFGNSEHEIKLLFEMLPSLLSSLETAHFNVQESVMEQLSLYKSLSGTSSSHSQLLSSQLSSSSSPVKTCAASSTSTTQTNVTKSIKQPIVTHKMLKHNSISAVYDSTIGSQEEIHERAKQEAYVMQRIGDLRKEGLWTLKRLPKVQEQPRAKAHWDYLLEEMEWLAADFAQERKWKKATAKKCSRMIVKYFQERELKAEKAEKEEQLRLRRIANQLSKDIKQFWSNIEKLVEYKQQTWLEEKRKKALDSHLNYIVDQTEKYSSWLTQGLNRTFQESSCTSRTSSPTSQKLSFKITTVNDEEFHPDTSESDDEETIEKEEEDMKDYDESEEVKLLQEEGELPLEDLLETLPPEILERPASPINDDDSSGDHSESKQFFKNQVPDKKQELSETALGDDDDEFQAVDDESDDEETIELEEQKTPDYSEELKDLQAESELPIEELYEKYKDAYASDFEMPESDESESENDKMSIDENVTSSSEDNEIDIISASAEDIDENNSSNLIDTSKCKHDKNPTKDITDIAATAESFQPKGNTLSTTQVFTKVPFLLKHTLREYQHIGLDWLNAMYEKKLNGILADEMGLGKTIQTIALLAHLACEKGIWGPHLIVVPTSVMLNWEMEIKKWCPAFKILTYYGTPKERKQKRIGWTKPNAFHICITSYKLVVQDHHSFRRKRWVYFILDEAQHIKNFKSQRWQMLLNFQSSHRLLLTGTPLQNDLMELWSLMHFLMPNVFQSHREFREWFVNPVTGMIEGSHEYNDSLIKRLHKVLRPFLLRRLKCEVEKQLPKKYEHVIMCRLSKRQRFLYDDFMSQTKTKETLATGNFMSVINILMQLRKVCNHPNMFEARPIMSPFQVSGITFYTASMVWSALDYDPFKHINLRSVNIAFADVELELTAFVAHRIKKFQIPVKLIEEIDSAPDPPPPCPASKVKFEIPASHQYPSAASHTAGLSTPRAVLPPTQRTSSVTAVRGPVNQLIPGLPAQRYMVVPGQPHSAAVSRISGSLTTVSGHPITTQHTQPAEYTLQLLQQPSGGPPVAQLAPIPNQISSTPITVQIQQTMQGGTRVSMPLGIGRLVQTSTGQHLLLAPAVSAVNSESASIQPTITTATVTYPGIQTVAASLSSNTPNPNIATATVLPQVQKIGTPTAVIPPIMATFSRPQHISPIISAAPSPQVHNKPVGRVAPLNIHPPATTVASHGLVNQNQISSTKSPVVHSLSKVQQPPSKTENSVDDKKETTPILKINNDSQFFLESLAIKRAKIRKEKLRLLGKINLRRCAAYPIYGIDLVETVKVTDMTKYSARNPRWYGRGYVNCLNAPFMEERRRSQWLYSRHLCDIIYTPEKYLESLRDIINRFVFVVPAVTAPPIQLHVSHPPPSKLIEEQRREEEFNCQLSSRCALFHPVISNTKTQFPELRLIEYDCGKLQRLALLLRELKTNHHRVLIFTQMTRMLDILEQFLNYHGHTYLRLDGNTKVDQRQALMERFNADKRVFCFILSTRSGGIGVNLTGADTVIFYDSDWNPTMDAQAQDRCHRIGQTRDVHIYRLISERTIEENILKKANQKRILGNVAIEGGNFTTAFFKKNTLHELFGISVHEEVISKTDAGSNVEESAEPQNDSKEQFSNVQLEQALGMAEEDLDLQAAKTAKEEAAAELAEFDESIPFDNEEKSPAEEELEKLMDQLTPIEKYAMQFLESLQEPFSREQLKQAEEEIEAQKRDWELGRLKALKEEEERRANLLRSEDPLLCYTREDAYSQVSNSSKSKKSKFRGKNDSKNQSSNTPKRRSTRINVKKEKVRICDGSDDSDSIDIEISKTSTPNHIYRTSNSVPNGPSKNTSNKKNTNVVPSNVKFNAKISANKCNISRLQPKVTSTPVVLKPFSNPNLVIRTRRASAIEAEEKSRSESESELSVSSPKPVNSPLWNAVKSNSSNDISLSLDSSQGYVTKRTELNSSSEFREECSNSCESFLDV